LREERPRYGCRELHFSRDGKWLAGPADQGPLTVWDAATLKEVRVLALHTARPEVAAALAGATPPLSPAAALPAATPVAPWAGHREAWRSWRVAGFSADSKRLVTAHPAYLCSWDVATGHKVYQADWGPRASFALDTASEGSRVAFPVEQDGVAQVELWDAR